MLWLLLKGIPIEKSYIGKLYYIMYIYNIHTKNIGVNKGSLLWSAVSFNPCIRGPDGIVGLKKPEVKNLVTGSL
jgi:hypothetical protein